MSGDVIVMHLARRRMGRRRVLTPRQRNELRRHVDRLVHVHGIDAVEAAAIRAKAEVEKHWRSLEAM